jgi:hypothetical protein
MDSQNTRLLEYLLKNGKITPLIALSELGIYRLAARASDLKNMGLNVSTRLIKVSNRWGETSRVAEYSLGE